MAQFFLVKLCCCICENGQIKLTISFLDDFYSISFNVTGFVLGLIERPGTGRPNVPVGS